MTFLNPLMLAGLAVVAVPLLIHLLNRRKARTVDWGAMQFLAASLARRNRKIIVEEMILMVLRCLGLGLVVLAMARPFVPAGSRVSWALVLPALLLAMVLAAVGTVMRSRRGVRYALLIAAAVMVLSAVGFSLYELRAQHSRWQSPGGGTDLAVVVDSSRSTGLRLEESTVFSRQVAEAMRAAATADQADTVCIVRAGPDPREPWLAPTSEPGVVEQSLERLAQRGPTSGAVDLPAALELAAEALARAPNADKRILLVSDGQRHGWRAENSGVWQIVGQALDSLPTVPRVVHRVIPPPQEYANLSVLDVELPDRALLPGWPVPVEVTVQNTGTAAAPTRTASLSAHGQDARSQEVGALLPGDSRTLQFELTFDQPGRQVLRVDLSAPADTLPADDTAVRVAYVVESLRVLVVDGRPSRELLESASDYVMAALAPRPQPGGLQPTVVTPDTLPPAARWDDYDAVVLAEVPRLPAPAARALAVAVQGGTGLLIAPGPECDPDFYNELVTPDGTPLCPAELVEFVRRPQDAAQPALDTFRHPALRPLAEPEPSDIRHARVEAWWQMEARPQPDGGSTTGAQLSTGSPLLAAWQRGAGRACMTAMALHHRSGNLVTRRAFVPMLHELVYHLAAGSFHQTNLQPGEPAVLTVQLPEDVAVPASVEVLTPGTEARSAAVRPAPDGVEVRFAATREPGLYRVTLPGRAYDVPFAVVPDPGEASPARLTEADLARVRQHVDVFTAPDTAAMVDAVRGEVPGTEMWRQMLICALVVLLAEVAVGHWVNVRRRAETAREVEFGGKEESAASVRARFQQGRAGSREEERA